MRVLVAEDDPGLRQVLVMGLKDYGYQVDAAERGDDAIDLFKFYDYDVAVIDWRMPGVEGIDVVAWARKHGKPTAILMLTARDTPPDRIRGLDAGADDYLVKPFAYEELLARLRALGRRPPPRSTMRLSAGPIVLDEALRRVDVAGKEVQLSGREYSILECLLRRPGQVLSRDQLLDNAWPYGAALTPNTVEAYIHLLRDKLGPDAAACIETVRGMGYRLRGD